MMRTVTAWVGDLEQHPGALVLARHRFALDTEAAYEAMQARTWRPGPAPDGQRRPAPEAWWAAVRRLHRGDVRFVGVVRVSTSRAREVRVQIGDSWLYCYIPGGDQ